MRNRAAFNAALRLQALDRQRIESGGRQMNALLVAASGGLGQKRQTQVLTDLRLLYRSRLPANVTAFGDPYGGDAA